MPIIYLLVIFAGCKQQKDSPLEKALSLAGENRIELEKVLNRYAAEPGDSLKYKAACFLLSSSMRHLFKIQSKSRFQTAWR